MAYKIARSSTKGHSLCGELDAGTAMDWRKHIEVSVVEAKAPTVEAIHVIDYSRRLELFENACKVFAASMEVSRVLSRTQFFSWFRATLTSWLYVLTKNHMKKYQNEYRQFLAEIGP